MSDEPKAPPEAAGPSETPAKVDSPSPPKPEGATPSPPAAVKSAAPSSGAAGAPPSGSPPKGAAPPAKPAPKPVVKAESWSSPLVDELQKRFPGAIIDAVIFRNQPSITLAKEQLIAVGEYLKSEEGGAYTLLTDETAVDYPKREKRFEVVYHVYSFQLNHRLRFKVLAADGEKIPSVAGLWPTANWLEREVFDMFGVLYEGHPDLRRILLPDEWVGHPLRKDYDILKQDDAWVEANLHIPSGQ
ncbi:MAG TPA: NADH-quinone oxidoreductase subunit C [Terriglobia bacterium]|nr:NADH-quinone oxidoreductase subunit C [Terriglobia bacterium]